MDRQRGKTLIKSYNGLIVQYIVLCSWQVEIINIFVLDLLLYLAFLKLSLVAGGQVGKSDFNKNPVVSPDLDLDF